MAEGEASERRQAILGAASRCFEEFGIAKTSMRDVAEAAGISRQALYRSFGGRQDLVEAVIEQRLRELVDTALPAALACGSFADAFLEAALAAVRHVRRTPDLRRLLRETSIDTACRTLLRPGGEAMRINTSLWKPILEWGRSRGEVADGLSDDEFIDWTGTMLLVYSAREDIADEDLRALLAHQALPAVTSPA